MKRTEVQTQIHIDIASILKYLCILFTVTVLGGVVFIACALITFFLESSESEAY